MSDNFWQTKSLFEMNTSEWESICDGCAKCCLQQLEDENTRQLVFTDIACDLLDCNTCRCSDYSNRSVRVPSCMTMNKQNIQECAEFAPPSCAYVLLLEGQPLPSWHHLLSNDQSSIHSAGKSVQNRVRYQRDIESDNLEDFVVDWVVDSGTE